MGFIKRVPKPCYCALPPVEGDYGLETVWECDNCKMQYILKDSQRDGKHWEKQWKGLI